MAIPSKFALLMVPAEVALLALNAFKRIVRKLIHPWAFCLPTILARFLAAPQFGRHHNHALLWTAPRRVQRLFPV